MIKESKRKLLHYRRATFLQPIGRTLQELLEEALKDLSAVGDRIRHINDDTDDGWQQFINTHRSALGMELGNLVLYAPDQNRQIIAIDHKANELDIEQLSPPSGPDGKKRQFLESLLYYGAMGNHLILLQSVALRARDLEAYLNYFLRKAQLLSDENAIYLNNYTPVATHERLENSEVKSVRIGTPLVDTAINIVDEAASNKQNKHKFIALGEGLEILKACAGDRMKGIDWNDLHSTNNLEVFVEVTYKRQTDPRTQNLLNQVTTALRHANDEDVRIELKGGGTVIGSDLQVKNYINIDSYNGLVDPTDLFPKMNAWLIELLDRALIDAE